MCHSASSEFKHIEAQTKSLTDAIFKRIFFKESIWISIKISLRYVRKGPIGHNYKSALNQVMAWRRLGDKSLSEPMLA